MQRIKRMVGNAGLLYITLYLPFAILVYTPFWFQLHSSTHPRSRFMPPDIRNLFIHELNHFFLHKGSLVTQWTEKEKFHLLEVRQIFDLMAVLFILAIAATVLLMRHKYKNAAKINLILLSILGLILPFFAFFWRDIMHGLMFTNQAWLNTPEDVSFYLMPLRFFKYSFVIVVLTAVLCNFIIWWTFRFKCHNANKSKIS